MSGLGVGVMAAVLGSLLVSWLLNWLILWRVSLTSPRGIMRRISRPGHRHVVHYRQGRFSWNPAVPIGRAQQRAHLNGPATASYWIGEDGLVHVEYRPENGSTTELMGPVPDGLIEVARVSTGRFTLVYLILAAAGFLVGFGVEPGDAASRTTAGLIGGIFGFLVAWPVAVAISVRIRRRIRMGRPNTPSGVAPQ